MSLARKRRLLISFFGLLTASFICFAVLTVKPVKAELNLDGEIKSEYILGEELVLPSATISSGGETKTATAEVSFPSGIKSSGNCTLNEYGNYSVKYTADFSGVAKSETVEFSTVKRFIENYPDIKTAYNVSFSSATFQNKDYLWDGTPENPVVTTLTKNAMITDFPTEELPLKFNESVDLKELTGTYDSIVTFGIPGDKTDGAPYKNIFVKVADSVNPDVYFEVRIVIGDSGKTWYFSVKNSSNYGFSNEDTTNAGVRTTYNGKNSTERYVDGYASAGGAVVSSIWGKPVVSVRYDEKDNSVYILRYGATKDDSLSWHKIANFNDKAQYDNQWEGFNSESVNVTFSAADGTSMIGGEGTGKLAIVALGKENADASWETKTVKDTNEPFIKINYDEISKEELQYFTVGETYPVLKAEVFDDCSDLLKAEYKVYHAYGTENQREITVKDGEFTVDKLGKYTYFYNVTDWSGNTYETLVDAYAYDAVNFYDGAELSCEIEKTYCVGDTFNPSALLSAEGVTVTPYVLVFDPYGIRTVLAEGEGVRLDYKGLYKVKFIEEINGKIYLVEKEFFAVDADYSCFTNATETKLASVNFVEPNNGYWNPQNGDVNSDALSIEVPSAKSPMKYKEAITLSELGDASLIKFGYAGERGTATNKYPEFFVKVEDSENPDVYFEVKLMTTPKEWYFTATNSSAGGVYGYTSYDSDFKAGSTATTVRHPNAYASAGALMHQSFFGLPFTDIVYNTSENAVYASFYGQKRADVLNGTYRQTQKELLKIIDFDDSVFATAFGGFPSGKVFVSFYGEDNCSFLTGGTYNKVALMSIGKDSAKDILKKGIATDDTPPKIEFADIDAYNGVNLNADNLVWAQGVYLDYEYAVKTADYKWYSVVNGTENILSSTAEFTPTETGLYILRVHAVDYFGNENTEDKYFGVYEGVGGKNAEAVFPNGGFEYEYEIGEVIKTPKVKLRIGSGEVDASVAVFYPNGKAYESDNLRLDVAGLYKYVITASVNGVEFQSTDYFTVRENLYLNGKAEYFEKESVFPSGVKISLKKGEVLRYNKPINVNGLGVDTPVYEIVPYPEVLGVSDFSKITVRLTDAYNPDNWIEFYTMEHTSLYRGLAVNTVGLPGQGSVSFYSWNGYIYKNSAERGAMTNTPFAAMHHDTVTTVPIGGYYDSSDFKTYAMNPAGNPNPNFMADLNDKDYFANFFTGFTTGDVYISIYADNYRTSDGTATFILSKLCGNPVGDELTFIDVNEPLLFEDATYSLPNGAVGIAYKLPKVVAKDNSLGNIATDVKVYYNYYGANPVLMNIENGTFTPRLAGVYTAVFASVDDFGNTAEMLYDLTIEKETRNVEVFVDGSLEINANLGEYVSVGNCSYNGGYGKLTLKVTAVSPSGKVINTFIGDSFKVDEAGEYSLTYRVEDYHGQCTEKTVKITVTESGNPVFISDFKCMPKVLFNNNGVNLPDIKAAVISGGNTTEAEVKIFVKDGLYASFTEINGLNYIPTVNASGDTVEIKFVATANGKETEKVFEISVIDVGYKSTTSGEESELDILKYFYTNSATLTANEEDITVNYSAGNSEVAFYNAVLAAKFLFKANLSDFNGEKITFNLIDFDSSLIGLSITLYREEDECRLSVNDSDKIAIANPFKDEFTVTLSLDGKTLTVNGDEFDLTALSDGSYIGFPSGKIYFGLEISGATADGSIKLLRLNNQSLKRLLIDTTNPEFYSSQVVGGVFELNSVYTVKKGFAADVLDMNVTCGLSVKLGTKYLTAKDGTLLRDAPFDRDYEIVLDRYGIYSINYTCSTDSFVFGKSGSQFTINVLDEVCPEITVDTKEETVELNSEVTVRTATVSDNYDEVEDLTVEVFFVTPKDRIFILREDSFTADEKGEYRVLYRVTDTQGNIAVAEYRVIVK